jgi:hypothetical protein
MAGTSCVPSRRLGWAIASRRRRSSVRQRDRCPRGPRVLGPAGAAGLLAIVRWAGLSWGELGLGRDTWRRGLLWALAAIGAVAVVFAAGAALPLTRGAFRDPRYQLGWGHALLTAFVLIPLGTVLFEEVAFRGVLWGPAPARARDMDGHPRVLRAVRPVACAPVTGPGQE